MQGKLLFLEVEVMKSLSRIIKAPYVHLQDKKVINTHDPIAKKEQNENIQQEKISSAQHNIHEQQKIILTIAKEEAKSILDQAERQKYKILKQIQQEKETIFQEAFQKGQKQGYQEGYETGYETGSQKGYRKGKQEAVTLKQEAKQILQSAHEEKEKIIGDIEPKMVQLIGDILEKMIDGVTRFHPTTILYLIKKGFEETSFRENLQIYVSEEDYDTVLKYKEDLLQDIESEGDIVFVKESSLQAGDCIIETPAGNIDCSLDSQLQEVKKELYLLLEKSE